MTSRRAFLTQASTTLAGSSLLGSTLLESTLAGSLLLGRPHDAAAAEMPPMMMRKIPSSGEPVPVIGLGTSGSFEISADSPEYAALKEVLKRFFGSGASLIDTAPTYGNAENILGPLLAETNTRRLAFIATKLSRVTGKDEGLAQFRGTLCAFGERLLCRRQHFVKRKHERVFPDGDGHIRWCAASLPGLKISRRVGQLLSYR